MCLGCERTAPCWKECLRCGEFACLRCERADIQLLDDSEPADVLFENKECHECNKINSVVFFDRESGLVVCYGCSNNPRKKAPIFCKNKHLLAYIKNKYVHEVCSSCNETKKCRLVCKQCKPETVYCARCKPTDLRKSCYLGHPLKESKNTIFRECLICCQYRPTYDCLECNLNICESCRQMEVIKPKLVMESR